jgi:hypothetical protein
LALDNLLSAELVLADGRRVTASPDADAELFWAIRGGGGNFGVVTGLTYRLHPLATVLAGMIMFPLVQAASVLRGYAAFLAAGPDEITVMAGFLCGPDGQTVLFLCPFYSGEDLRTGERLIASLESLGEPVMSQIAPMEYNDALGMFDNGMGDGNHYHLRTRWLPALSEEAAEILIDTAGRITSPHSGLALHHFHGAARPRVRGEDDGKAMVRGRPSGRLDAHSRGDAGHHDSVHAANAHLLGQACAIERADRAVDDLHVAWPRVKLRHESTPWRLLRDTRTLHPDRDHGVAGGTQGVGEPDGPGHHIGATVRCEALLDDAGHEVDGDERGTGS